MNDPKPLTAEEERDMRTQVSQAVVVHNPSVQVADGTQFVIGLQRILATLDTSRAESAKLAVENAALREAASEVMDALTKHGQSIVPHLLDNDENAGERLRAILASPSPAVSRVQDVIDAALDTDEDTFERASADSDTFTARADYCEALIEAIGRYRALGGQR